MERIELNKLLILNPIQAQNKLNYDYKSVKLLTQLRLQTPSTLNFSSVGNDLARTIPSERKKPKDYLRNCIQPSYFVFSTTLSEIEDEISKLQLGKSTVPFSISEDILKLLKKVLSKLLEIIFNPSFTSGIVPTNIKLGNINPVFKKCSQTC